jgi:protein neuralized
LNVVHYIFKAVPTQVSTSWSGVLRLGFTSVDPATIDPAQLPRYACPDLTTRQGYWAKALPERFAEQGTVIVYGVTRSGDVRFGVNGQDKGIFFADVNTSGSLWALIDIYGNSTGMQFIGQLATKCFILYSFFTHCLVSNEYEWQIV